MTNLCVPRSISKFLLTKKATHDQGDLNFYIRLLDSKSLISRRQCYSNLALIWIGLTFVGICFSLKLLS
jgi:hypothetical protein